MTLRTYVLMVILCSLLAVCTVHEVMRQTRARYQIGRLLVQEEDLRQDFAQLNAELAQLRGARRLEQIQNRNGLPLVPLRPVAQLNVMEVVEPDIE